MWDPFLRADGRARDVGTTSGLIELQRQVGNRAVVELLADRVGASLVPSRSDAIQRSALDDETTPAERANLQVLTLEPVSMLSADEIKDRMKETVDARPPADEVRFGANVATKIQRGLTHLAVEFAGNQLRMNSLVSVPLNLKAFGGVNGVYRFILVSRKTKPKRLLIIDQVSEKPRATLTKADIAKQEKRFKQFGFSVGSGFAGADDWRHLLTALARVPDASLKRAQGVKFVKLSEDLGPMKEPGHYDPTKNTITLYGATDQAYMSSADAGGADWFTYALMHEIGHAVDFGPFALALAKRDRLEREVAEAEKRAAQIDVDPLAGLDAPGKADAKRKRDLAEVARLKKELRKAETEFRKVSPGSAAARFSKGKAFGKAKGAPISSYGKKGGNVENYAELFAIYALDPDLLKSLRPKAFEYFETL